MDAFDDANAAPAPEDNNGLEEGGEGAGAGQEEDAAASATTPTAFPSDAIDQMEDLDEANAEVSGHLAAPAADPILTKDPNADLSMENLKISASPIPTQEEPETIKVWREKQKQLLEEKDQKEQKMMEELKEQAKKELADWYKKYNEQLEKTKDDNRQEEKTYVAEMNDIEPGTEWDRVHKLCDFNQKTSRNTKDTSRMRSILLQLKQNPKAVLAK